MKALLCCLFLLFAQETVPQDTHVIHVQASEGIRTEGMRFTVCADEEGNALTDDSGNPVVVSVNEDGDIVTDLEELHWIRINAPPAGFYQRPGRGTKRRRVRTGSCPAARERSESGEGRSSE